jgi:hypothetical protein
LCCVAVDDQSLKLGALFQTDIKACIDVLHARP